MTCDQAHLLLERRDRDDRESLPAGSLMDHLAECGNCRERTTDADPSLLFALAALQLPQPDWTGFTLRVRVHIESERRSAGWIGRVLDSGIFAPKRLVPALATAAVAALAVLAVRQTMHWQAAPEPTRLVQTIGPPASSGAGALGALVVRNEPDAVAQAGPLPAPVETVASPKARIVHMQIGQDGEGESSDVVLILDEDIQL